MDNENRAHNFAERNYTRPALIPLEDFKALMTGKIRSAVYAYCSTTDEPELVKPEFCTRCPEIEEQLDIPHTLRFSPALGRRAGVDGVQGGILGWLCAGQNPG